MSSSSSKITVGIIGFGAFGCLLANHLSPHVSLCIRDTARAVARLESGAEYPCASLGRLRVHRSGGAGQRNWARVARSGASAEGGDNGCRCRVCEGCADGGDAGGTARPCRDCRNASSVRAAKRTDRPQGPQDRNLPGERDGPSPNRHRAGQSFFDWRAGRIFHQGR